MPPELHHIYTTSDSVDIFTCQGEKSRFHFIVRYQQPQKRVRTPKHIHIMIDLYLKRLMNETLTNHLLDHIINEIILKVTPNQAMPPRLQLFSSEQATRFEALNSYGEYSIEFILVVVELLMLQEKTNYPTGTLNLVGFQKFRNGRDIYSVVSAATFRGAA